MPIISAVNRSTTILQDICNWLSQIKSSGQPNLRLPLITVSNTGDDFGLVPTDIEYFPDLLPIEEGLFDLTYNQLADLTLNELYDEEYIFDNCTLKFYTDQAKTQLAFTDSLEVDEDAFSVIGNRLFYTPPDSLINNPSGLSTTLCQGIYWVTVTFSDGTIINTTYKNSANLMFQDVIVSNTPKPTFAKNQNQSIVFMAGEKADQKKVSGNWVYITLTFEVYVQLCLFDWEALSEQDRVQQRQNVTNSIRRTLYIDRNRNGQATFKDGFINGTVVSDMTPIKSDAVLRGMIKVQTASLVNCDDY